MNRRVNIADQVDKTLTSLDAVERAKANPFLFTRIRSRFLDADNSRWTVAARTLNRPVFAFATLVLVLLMNAAIFLQNNEPAQATNIPEEEQLFAREYNLSQGLEDGVLAVNNEEQP